LTLGKIMKKKRCIITNIGKSGERATLERFAIGISIATESSAAGRELSQEGPITVVDKVPKSA